jgi:hypothetical protein
MIEARNITKTFGPITALKDGMSNQLKMTAIW